MKIRISEKEFYVIELDKDEISPEEFSGFMNRLRIIEKILNKSDIIDNHSKNKKENNRGKRVPYPWINNKTELIKIFKIYYYGTKEQKDEIASKLGVTWEDISKNLFYQKKKEKITPKDLGLKYFPTLRGKHVNIKQAKVKGDDYD